MSHNSDVEARLAAFYNTSLSTPTQQQAASVQSPIPSTSPRLRLSAAILRSNISPFKKPLNSPHVHQQSQQPVQQQPQPEHVRQSQQQQHQQLQQQPQQQQQQLQQQPQQQPHQQQQQQQHQQAQQQQPQQQPQQQHQPQQQQEQQQQSTIRYSWDANKTRMMLSELVKYVQVHGYPKTSHIRGNSKQRHPYDEIASRINDKFGLSRGKACDGRAIESKYYSLKRHVSETVQAKIKEFETMFEQLADEAETTVDIIRSIVSFRSVEGQVPIIVIDPSSPHYKTVHTQWENMLTVSTVQGLPLHELISFISELNSFGYSVKKKRPSQSTLARDARKKARESTRDQLDMELDVDSLADTATDSDVSSSSRSSRSSTPKASTKAAQEMSFLSSNTTTANKLSQLIDLMTAERQQHQQDLQQQQSVKIPLSSTYGSINDFFDKEGISLPTRDRLMEMGLSRVEDIAVLNDDVLRRAGVPEIAAMRIHRKIQSHALPF